MRDYRSLIVLSLLLSLPWASTLHAQGLLSDPSPMPGYLEVDAINMGGEVTALLQMVGEDGVLLGDVTASFAVQVNGNEDTLDFRQGYAKLPLPSERVGALRIDYQSPEGPAVVQQGYHTVGAQTRSGRVLPWTSVIPPLVAIALALLFREVVSSLLLGVLAGAWILLGAKPSNFFAAITDTFEFFILGSIANSDHAAIILFSMLIGGMVAVISRNGGMYGVVEKICVLANSARNAQGVTWLLGVAIFFDDYANTLVVGNTMRPVTDRFRVSREKLAYIVDSTAAPVAAIAFITTWIGAELDYIAGAIAQLGINESAYGIFLGSLRYSFYPVLTLAFIVMLVWMKRDFGFMHKAEMRARTTGQVSAPSIQRKGSTEDLADLEPEPGIVHRWSNAFFPVLAVILVTMMGLWVTGFQSLRASGHEIIPYWDNGPAGEKLRLLFSSNLLSDVVGAANSYTALIWASAAGLLLAVLLSVATRALNLRDSVVAASEGFKTMLSAVLILVLAWSLAAVTEQLHTASFLTGVFSERLDPRWMPGITFVFAAVISFSTGSSWSTMAILYPLILPLTWTLGITSGMEEGALMAIFHNVTACVLAGSVLGDHCSPISDTTVLSSLASNCNHIDHVRTQLPYAMTVGAISILGGGVLVVLGVPNWIVLIASLFALWCIVRFVGKAVPDYKPATEKAAQNG